MYVEATVEAPGSFYFAGNRGKRGGVGCGGRAGSHLPRQSRIGFLVILLNLSPINLTWRFHSAGCIMGCLWEGKGATVATLAEC